MSLGSSVATRTRGRGDRSGAMKVGFQARSLQLARTSTVGRTTDHMGSKHPPGTQQAVPRQGGSHRALPSVFFKHAAQGFISYGRILHFDHGASQCRPHANPTTSTS